MVNEMRKSRLATILVVIAVLIGVIVCGGVNVLPQLMQAASMVSTREASVREMRQNIALRLGINPDWEEIERHLYCEIVKVGRSREHVETDLLVVGTYKVITDPAHAPTGMIFYDFDEIGIYWVIRGVYVRYDEANQVEQVKIREGGGSMEAYTDRQFDCLVTPSK